MPFRGAGDMAMHGTLAELIKSFKNSIQAALKALNSEVTSSSVNWEKTELTMENWRKGRIWNFSLS